MSEAMGRDGFALFYRSYVQSCAEGAARSSSVVEADDVEMAIWEYLYSRFDYFSEMKPDAVKWVISRKANEVSAKERRDYEYYRGAFVYTTTFVRTVLEEAAWSELDEVFDIDAKVDVMSAFGKLKLTQQRTLFKRFGLLEPLTEAEKKMANRAINRITDLLNDSVDLNEVELVAL